MKTFHIISVAALLLLAACAKELPSVSSQGDNPRISVVLSFPTKSAGSAPIVNSVRILAYDGNAVCALNEMKTSGISPVEVSDGYTIDLGEFELESSTSRNYDLYAILNEDGFTLEGTESAVSSLLGGLSQGERNMNLFLSCFNSPAHYSVLNASDGEPIYLMSGVAGYTMEEGDSQTPRPVSFDLVRRPYAQVTVGGITTDGVSSDNLSRIIIQNVSLVNIPSGFAWGNKQGECTSNPITINFPGKNSYGFYSSTNSMSLDAEYTGIRKKRSIEGKMYCIADKVFNFVEQSSAKIFGKSADANNAWSGKIDKNSYPAFLSTLQAKFDEVPFTLSYTSDVTLTPSAWNIDFNRSYYIPENISSEAKDATCICIKAAIADPGLSESQIDERASWSPDNITIGSNVFPLSWPANNTDINTLKAIPVSTEVYIYNDKGVDKMGYLAYFEGFKETRTAPQISISGATGNDICMNPTSHVFEFLIPINNNIFDGDYSVRRNTKYTVMLHVAQSTYETLQTKAGANSGISISATVISENAEDYED